MAIFSWIFLQKKSEKSLTFFIHFLEICLIPSARSGNQLFFTKTFVNPFATYTFTAFGQICQYRMSRIGNKMRGELDGEFFRVGSLHAQHSRDCYLLVGRARIHHRSAMITRNIGLCERIPANRQTNWKRGYPRLTHFPKSTKKCVKKSLKKPRIFGEFFYIFGIFWKWSKRSESTPRPAHNSGNMRGQKQSYKKLQKVTKLCWKLCWELCWKIV